MPPTLASRLFMKKFRSKMRAVHNCTDTPKSCALGQILHKSYSLKKRLNQHPRPAQWCQLKEISISSVPETEVVHSRREWWNVAQATDQREVSWE